MPSKNTIPSPAESAVWADTPSPDTSPKTPAGNTALAEPPQKTARDTQPIAPGDRDYDIDGLMTDFPTARDLERFVFDETGVVLNLKGRANRVKYETALRVLEGDDVDPQFLGRENPYVDKSDMVPTDEIGHAPPDDPACPAMNQLQNSFHSRQVPHPDAEYRAQGRRCEVTFRKYNNGVITYEILGPIEPRPFGEKIDKYGRSRPEIIRWVDPRSGQQIMQRTDGTLTPMGRRLRALLQSMKVNDSNFWTVWVDREFISLDESAISNPWS